MLSTAELFCLEGLPTEISPLLEVEHPWEVLELLDTFMVGLGDDRRGKVHPTAVLEGPVFLAEDAVVGPHAYVRGPSWIGAGCRIGHGAYLRGQVVLAPGAFVGHSTEVKRSVFLPKAKAPHFNYVGDSVLGRGVNLGAGVKVANVSALGGPIQLGNVTLRKFGSALGDNVSVGCNAVLAPGVIVGKRTVIYAGAMVRGQVDADSIVKFKAQHEIVPRRLSPNP
jgi:NDP-sugar pyrophosphorylase family protein